MDVRHNATEEESLVNAKRGRNGDIVLITGGTRGIGYAAAARFLKNGDRVAILCRHKNHVETAAEQLKALAPADAVLGMAGDVREVKDVRRIVSNTLDRFGRIDVLVNNAGVAVWKPIEETSEQEWDETLDTNLKGSFLFTREVVPVMRKQGYGVIVNISSGLGVSGEARYSAYSASKFGLMGLTQVVAAETRDAGLRVYAVVLGGVATQLHLNIHPWEETSRMMTPDYVADKLFELARGRRETGTSIEV